tara:strand:+ start:496 stop:897 length:402 start_codon:yes stop_codon:yes gene_type:complete
MATITLTFANEVNTSLQAKSATVASGQNTTNYGESVANDVGGFDNIYFVRNGGSEVIFLGNCTGISSDRKTVTVTYTGNIRTPVADDFILFAKDTAVNKSGILGYFAEVEMKNSADTKVELFAVGSEVLLSSK